MSAAPFDPLGALRVLQDHRADFLLIGGLASRVYGSPLITNDLDICYARNPDNLERLATALKEMEARLRGAPADVPLLLEAETIAAGDHFTFITVFGGVDCLGTPAGSAGYEDLRKNAVKKNLDGIEVSVVSLDDLISMKLAAGHPKDLYQAEALGALREETDSKGREGRD